MACACSYAAAPASARRGLRGFAPAGRHAPAGRVAAAGCADPACAVRAAAAPQPVCYPYGLQAQGVPCLTPPAPAGQADAPWQLAPWLADWGLPRPPTAPPVVQPPAPGPRYVPPASASATDALFPLLLAGAAVVAVVKLVRG